MKGRTYFVKGMYCASCEILIEKKLLEEKSIEAVEASTTKSEVRIECTGQTPSPKSLNKIFQKNNYIFSDKPFSEEKSLSMFQFKKDFPVVALISLLIIAGFLFLNKSGLAALVGVNSQSALPAFLIFGLLAGFSTCSALIGGIILSMAKQWEGQKFQPHFLFNAGRLISYILLGALLGVLGSALQISPTFTAGLTVVVSILMVFLALQMLGVKGLCRFQFTTPKSVTRFVADEKNFKGHFMPFLMGAGTFFLPCGFTLTVQGLALTSGKPLPAALIMLFFALGTLPALLLISFSTVKFTQKPHFAGRFLKIAGVLVLFFGLYNLNAQLNVLGFKSLNDLKFFQTSVSKDGLPPIINGKQILKTDALAFGYEPNQLKVKAGIPVRREITDKGTSGCTNAIISRSLFEGEIRLTPGETSVKEFTPQKPGQYKFSCWMGMVSGMIEVIK